MSLTAKRGDTIIEVTIAITVFCIISIITMGIMDRNLNSIQGALELEMARNEIDAQAEALRFIHNSFLSEREYTEKEYENLWKSLALSTDDPNKGLANAPGNISPFTAAQCSVYYDKNATASGQPHSIITDHAFVVNTRNLDPGNVNATIISATKEPNKFINTTLYPRIVYTTSGVSADTDSSLAEATIESKTYDQISTVEGLWVIATHDATDASGSKLSNASPEFFDFHIRTCWYPPNQNYPTTIATIIRLYNPEVIKEAK